MKLNDVYNKWLSVKRRQVKESTLSCYQLIYIKILAPRFGSTDVETMNKKVVTTFLYELLDSGTKSKKILLRYPYSHKDAYSLRW